MRINGMRRLAPFLLTFLIAASAHAGGWASRGPDGGRVNALAIDPSDSSHLLAGTDNGLFVSTDGAASWTRIHYVDKYEVTHVAIDPTNPSIEYVAYGQVESVSLLIFRHSKLFRSADGGLTWSEVTNFGTQISISSLEVDAAGNVYVGFRCGIEAFASAQCATCPGVSTASSVPAARSTDHGATWRSASAASGEEFRCIRGVTADPQMPGVVYAHSFNVISSSISANWRSTDGGLTFAATTTPGSPGKNLLVHPLTKRRFAANGGGTLSDFGVMGDRGYVVVSDDDGSSWRKIALPPVVPVGQSIIVGEIAIDPASQDTLYLATDHGFYRTTNLGDTWERLFAEVTYAVVVTPSRLYIGTAVGLFISGDGGKTWSQSNLRDNAVTAVEIAVDPNRPATLFAWIEDFEVLPSIARSADAGTTWERLPPFANRRAYADPQPVRPRMGVDAAGTVYVLNTLDLEGTTMVARFRDGATNWEVLPYPDLSGNALLADPNAAGTIYGFSYNGTERKSVDGGTTWSAPVSVGGTYLRAAAIDPIDSRTLFVSTSEGLKRSTDGGMTWVRLGVGAPYEISVSPADHSLVWSFMCCEHLEKSTDGGTTWNVLPIPSVGFRRVLADGVDPNVVYLWSLGGGVYRSVDGGATWAAFSEGLSTGDINWMAAPRRAAGLYAATFRRGVFTRSGDAKIRAIRRR
jgi:photosystem II stability/assembly factor-like uncharacterized protein